MSPSTIGVSIDSKAYELATFYVETWRRNGSTRMTDDKVAEFTRRLALDIRESADRYLEKESCVREGFEGESAFY